MAVASTTQDNIAWVIDHWPQLVAARLKGTRSGWNQKPMTAKQREQLDAAAFREANARRERQEVGAEAIGSAPAPIHLTPFDMACNIMAESRALAIDAARETCDLVRLVAATRHDQPNPYRYLRYLGSVQVSDFLAYRIRTALVTFRGMIEGHIDGEPGGQIIHDDCPFCHQRKVTVRYIGPPANEEMVLRCESGDCKEGQRQASRVLGGMPVWTQREWEWLMGHLDYNAAVKAVELAEAMSLTGPPA